MNYYSIIKSAWDDALEYFLQDFNIYGTLENESGIDYEIIDPSNVKLISYNKPKPAVPLKIFFLPVKENVSRIHKYDKKTIIIGSPNCDVVGLNILDEIYLDRDYVDPFYKERRENTIIIATDCHSINEHCHCYSYGVNPYGGENSDISVSVIDGEVFLMVYTKKGEDLINRMPPSQTFKILDESSISLIKKKHTEVISLIRTKYKALPDYIQTGNLIRNSGEDIWKKYAVTCVSCGSCATICPTCTCFLLLDKPGFEKVKQLDACQYPGFERVAGGEDPLRKKFVRFRNRYLCKYVWKPEKFKSIACTGCGRCIETCIGKISKNELFMELANIN